MNFGWPRQLRLPAGVTKALMGTNEYAFDFIMSIGSLWAAKCLILPPSNFLGYPEQFRLASQVLGNENYWAAIAVVSAGLKIAALLAMKCGRCGDTADYLRLFGLALSGFFWLVMGASVAIGNPDSIGAAAMLVIAFSCYRHLYQAFIEAFDDD